MLKDVNRKMRIDPSYETDAEKISQDINIILAESKFKAAIGSTAGHSAIPENQVAEAVGLLNTLKSEAEYQRSGGIRREWQMQTGARWV